MKAKLNFIRLLTENFKEMFDFYSRDLGLEVLYGGRDENYSEFETGGTKLTIFSRKAMLDAIGIENPSNFHECSDQAVMILEVDNVDAVYNTLLEKGVIFLTSPEDREEWTVRTAHLRDPEGNLIEINQQLSKR